MNAYLWMLIISLVWASIITRWAIPETKPAKEGKPVGAGTIAVVFAVLCFAAWIPIFALWGAFKPSAFVWSGDSPKDQVRETSPDKLRKFRLACLALIITYPVLVVLRLTES